MSELSSETPLIEAQDFVELSFGDLEGVTFSESSQNFPQEMFDLRQAPDKYDPKAFNGETYPEMISRSTQVVRDAVMTHTEGPLLFVGHGAMLVACLRTLLGYPLSEVRGTGSILDNNSMTILNYDEGKFSLEEWNNTEFL